MKSSKLLLVVTLCFSLCLFSFSLVIFSSIWKLIYIILLRWLLLYCNSIYSSSCNLFFSFSFSAIPFIKYGASFFLEIRVGTLTQSHCNWILGSQFQPYWCVHAPKENKEWSKKMTLAVAFRSFFLFLFSFYLNG